MRLDGASSFIGPTKRLAGRPNTPACLAPLTSFTDSIRIPCTAANREYLRKLRAAEMAAWESVRPNEWLITRG